MSRRLRTTVYRTAVGVLVLLTILRAQTGHAQSTPRREDRGDLIVLYLSGSYRDMGRQAAELLGPLLREVYDRQLGSYYHTLDQFGFGAKLTEPLLFPLLVWTAPFYDDSSVFAEQAGIARTLGVARTDVLRSSLGVIPSSTVFAATRSATADGQAIIGRNVDWDDDQGRRRPIVAHITPTNGDLPYVFAAWPLLPVPTVGVNAAGVAISLNYFDTEPEVGLLFPAYPHRRVLQRARSVDDAIRILSAPRQRVTAGFFALADASGAIALVECATDACAVFRPTADWFGHTNHARTPEMIRRDVYRSEDSYTRQAAVEAAVQRRLGSITPQVAAEILRDRSNTRWVNDPCVGNVNVLNSAVVHPASHTLWHSTTMEPVAPFGEMVAFTPDPDRPVATSISADPRLNTAQMARERAAIEVLRHAARLFSLERNADAGSVLDELAERAEPAINPSRLTWGRALARLRTDRLQDADTLLAGLDGPEVNFDVRAHALVARAIIADHHGQRDAALGLYRRAQAYLDTYKQYTDRYSAQPMRSLSAAGLSRPQTGPLPKFADLLYVPR